MRLVIRAGGARLALGLMVLSPGLGLPFPAWAVSPPEPTGVGWNTPRVRALVRRAIERREQWTSEGEGLQDYQAHARGHIYFLFDEGRGTERHLIRADQLALNLFWRAPGQTRQVIVGRRDKKLLPTNIRYHIDHLTVVMDNFDDRIRMGEGSEVKDVLHPAAPHALAFYDYRLTDSLTLALPDRRIRVYRVDVRPHDPDEPGIVGSVYLDRETADIVRMEFTFTSSAYLDRTLDYIDIRLENALWDGRYWLPFRQGLELRRGMGFLDFPAGGIIRAEFQIGGYRFNTGFPASVMAGPSVTALPRRVQQAYPFDGGLYDALDPAVAVAPPSLEEVRNEAARIVRDTYLRRVETFRPAVPGVSSVFRFRRSEGLYAGPGFDHDLADGTSIRLLGGWAWGADRWEVEGKVDIPLRAGLDLSASGYANRFADATPWPASSGAISSLAGIFDGEDYREPYRTSGGGVTIGRVFGLLRAWATGAWEEWDPAQLGAADLLDRSYRPVRALDAGQVATLTLGLERRPASAVDAVGGTAFAGRMEAASHAVGGDFDFVQATAQGGRVWSSLGGEAQLRLWGDLGAVMGGRPPAQRLFPLGGRGTVRGYPFHGYVGDVYGRVSLEASRDLWNPFVTGRVFVDAGWVGQAGDAATARAVSVWNAAGPAAGVTRGPIVGAGVGVGLLFDVLRVEVAHGLERAGVWELVVEASPRFWSWL